MPDKYDWEYKKELEQRVAEHNAKVVLAGQRYQRVFSSDQQFTRENVRRSVEDLIYAYRMETQGFWISSLVEVGISAEVLLKAWDLVEQKTVKRNEEGSSSE